MRVSPSWNLGNVKVPAKTNNLLYWRLKLLCINILWMCIKVQMYFSRAGMKKITGEYFCLLNRKFSFLNIWFDFWLCYIISVIIYGVCIEFYGNHFSPIALFFFMFFSRNSLIYCRSYQINCYRQAVLIIY